MEHWRVHRVVDGLGHAVGVLGYHTGVWWPGAVMLRLPGCGGCGVDSCGG